MKIYALTASGPLQVLDGMDTKLCGKVFRSREGALNEKDSFLERCCSSPEGSPAALRDLEPGMARVEVIELELLE